MHGRYVVSSILQIIHTTRLGEDLDIRLAHNALSSNRSYT
jgi:hypothetical protein